MPEKDPLPVVIAAEQQDPIPVTVEPTPQSLAPLVIKGEGATLAPTTTEEADRVTSGQRHISRVWEYSQAFIAILVTATTVYVLATISISAQEIGVNQASAVGHLVVMATLILTFYFARTNHVAVGGIGPKATDKYEGR